jgi:N-acetylneuraminic acid mutarotase
MNRLIASFACTSVAVVFCSYSHADGFVAAASMHQARFGHTATLLQNGKVLIAGGGTIDETLASAELYDPSTNTWTTTGSLSTAREYHTATLLDSGKVLVVDGSDGPTTLKSAEIYDPVSSTWSAAGTPVSKRARHVAVLLSSGKVLVFFGFTADNNKTPTNSAELYDPSTSMWTSTGGAPLGDARALATGFYLPGPNYAIAYGGVDASGTPLASGAGYSITSGWIGPFPSMTTARYLFTANALPSGVALVAGGYNTSPSGTAELYDSSSNHWSSAGSMSSARYAHTATLLNTGDVLVTGGATTSSLATADIYTVAANSWSATGTMATSRAQHTATLLPTGKVLVCGGQTGSSDTAVETGTCELFAANEIYGNGFELPSK